MDTRIDTAHDEGTNHAVALLTRRGTTLPRSRADRFLT